MRCALAAQALAQGCWQALGKPQPSPSCGRTQCFVFGEAAARDILEHWHELSDPPAIRDWDESRVTDSDEEVKYVIDECAKMGVKAGLAKGWEFGGEGTTDLAKAVVESVESGSNDFKSLYDWSLSIEDKIKKISSEIYGAVGVNFTKKAELDLKRIKNLGLEHLPVCMAKTQKSFSDNDALRGRPEGFEITVREFEFAAGAGFIIPILGKMMRMPGLPAVPASEGMDIDENGVISGLS